jgi:hypothetical protein
MGDFPRLRREPFFADVESRIDKFLAAREQ